MFPLGSLSVGNLCANSRPTPVAVTSALLLAVSTIVKSPAKNSWL
jgi:hypothetical protein